MYRTYDTPAKSTFYNGNRFSSRLEARWAVYFDELGVSYNYGPEWFELPNYNYLPDFWIYDDPETCFWLEIKFSYPNEDEISKMDELVYETGDEGRILFTKLLPTGHEYKEFGACDLVGQVYFWSDGWSYSCWEDGGSFELPTFDRDGDTVAQALNKAVWYPF